MAHRLRNVDRQIVSGTTELRQQHAHLQFLVRGNFSLGQYPCSQPPNLPERFKRQRQGNNGRIQKVVHVDVRVHRKGAQVSYAPLQGLQLLQQPVVGIEIVTDRPAEPLLMKAAPICLNAIPFRIDRAAVGDTLRGSGNAGVQRGCMGVQGTAQGVIAEEAGRHPAMGLHELHRLGDAPDLLNTNELLLRRLDDTIHMQVKAKAHRRHGDHVEQAQHQKLRRQAQAIHPSCGDR